MRNKISQTIFRQEGFNHYVGQLNLQAKVSQSLSEFIIVGQVVDESNESANLLQVRSPEDKRRTQSEAYFAFERLCSQYARTEIGADAECFEPRTECSGRHSAIKTSHHPYARICQRRHHSPEIIAFDSNVAVIDNAVLVLRMRQHLFQIADLHVGAKNLRADH